MGQMRHNAKLSLIGQLWIGPSDEPFGPGDAERGASEIALSGFLAFMMSD
jgi:hypothetical protein